MFPFVLAIPLPILVIVAFQEIIPPAFLHPSSTEGYIPLIRHCLMAGIILSSYALVGLLFISWDMLLDPGMQCPVHWIGRFAAIAPQSHLHASRVFPAVTKRSNLLRSKFYELFYTRYTLLLLAFVLLSAITGFILHYHFVAETRPLTTRIRSVWPNSSAFLRVPCFCLFMGWKNFW